MSPLTFLHRFGLLTYPEVWDAHGVKCLLPALFITCRCLCIFRCPGSILLPQHSSWVGAEVGNILLGWPREAEAGGIEMDITSPWQLWASEDCQLLIFPILLLNPFSLSCKCRREFSIFGEAIADVKVSVFPGLLLVSQFPRHGSGTTGFVVVPKRFWLFAFKVTLRRTLQLHVRYWPPPAGQSGQGWGAFWRDGLGSPRAVFCMVSPSLAVRSFPTTVVWTRLVLPQFGHPRRAWLGEQVELHQGLKWASG